MRRALLAAAAAAALAGCGGGDEPASSAGDLAKASGGDASLAPDWARFGVVPQRTNEARRGVPASEVPKLRRFTIALPGTVDSSPVFASRVRAGGRVRDLVLVTTAAGRTLALDARTGRRVWQFVPPGISAWEGTYQFTNATPALDPDRTAVYAVSPDGLVHKLALSDGREASGWPVRITKLPQREKIAPALNVVGDHVLATTGGYIGDADPYQGHVVTIDRRTGRLHAIFNSLCSERRFVQVPSTCPASDSAIWGRGGAVVDPGTREVYVATGNGPFDGRRFWGDSVLVLSFPDLRLKRNWTPYNQAQLSSEDKDLGSASPALIADGLILQGGKDGRMDVLSRARPNGRDTRPSSRLGGQRQSLPLPGGAQVLVTAPAVSGRWVWVATDSATAGYRVERGELRKVWEQPDAGTSPVLAGGLLYVYDPGGRLNVLEPSSGRRVASLPAGAGHWNSPIVAGGRVWLPEGDANDQGRSGTLAVYAR